MIFRQLYDHVSSTYSYVLGSRAGGEALLVDPVLEHVNEYLELIDQLGLSLVLAMDTHVHADHVTALGELRDRTGCPTLMGEQTKATCVSVRVKDGETIRLDGIPIRALYTPGHTDDFLQLRAARSRF
jgi:sulfur dioxygenase